MIYSRNIDFNVHDLLIRFQGINKKASFIQDYIIKNKPFSKGKDFTRKLLNEYRDHERCITANKRGRH